MSYTKNQHSSQKGFTLVEVIIGVVMVSIAALIMLSFLESGLMHSQDPLEVLDDNFDIFQSIEIVNADYRTRLEQNSAQNINFYVSSDLSSTITGLSSPGVQGAFINFSNPDADRQVTETAATGATMYVKITAQRNNSKMVSIIGN